MNFIKQSEIERIEFLLKFHDIFQKSIELF